MSPSSEPTIHPGLAKVPVSLWLARALLWAQVLIAVSLARWGASDVLLREGWPVMVFIALAIVQGDTQRRTGDALALLHWLGQRRVPVSRGQAVAWAHAKAWALSLAWPLGALAVAAMGAATPWGTLPLWAALVVAAIVMVLQLWRPATTAAAAWWRQAWTLLASALAWMLVSAVPMMVPLEWAVAGAGLALVSMAICAKLWQGLMAAAQAPVWQGPRSLSQLWTQELARWQPLHRPGTGMSTQSEPAAQARGTVMLNLVMPYFTTAVIFKGGLFWGQGATSGEPLLLVLLAIQWMMALMIRDWQPRQALWPVGDRQRAGRLLAWRIWRDSLRPFALALAVLLAGRMAWWAWQGWPHLQGAVMAVLGPVCLVLPTVALSTWFSGLAKQHALHRRRGLPQPVWNWTSVGVLVVACGLALSLALTWWAWGQGSLSWAQAWVAMARSRQSGFVLPVPSWSGALLMLSLTPVFLWAASRVWARLPAECLTRADEAGGGCGASLPSARRHLARV